MRQAIFRRQAHAWALSPAAARAASRTLRGALPLLALACLLGAATARAHSVHIFAWTDGLRICTQSYFSKNSKVIGGEVSMQDSQGKELGRGVSDAAGMFCFAAPAQAQELLFSVNAGQGHRGSFLLPAAASRQAGDAAQGKRGGDAEGESLSVVSAGLAATGGESAHPAPGRGETALSPGVRDELLTMIRQELQREISPLRQALAEAAHDETPGLRDIIGGLGWIFGLAAAGSLYYKRKTRI